MPVAVLPGFGGLSFFTAVVQQQRKAHGYCLPVPHTTVSGEQRTQADAAESDQTADSPENWVQQTEQLTEQLGFAKQPLLDVAADAPRSKAERYVTKRSFAALGQQVQPSAVPCSATLGAEPAGQDGDSAAAGTQPPPPRTLGTIAARYAAEFTCGRRSSPSDLKPGSCSTTNHSTCSSGLSCPPGSSLAAGHVMGLQLDEPVMPAAGTAWRTRPHEQGPATLFCDPLELEELQRDISADAPQGAWDAAYTKVRMLPADYAATQDAAAKVPGAQAAGSAGAETPPTGAAPAVMPTIQHWVQAWVLQRHRLQQQHMHAGSPSTAAPAMSQGACPDSRPTTAPTTTSTSAAAAAAADSAAAAGGEGAEQHTSQAYPAASEGAVDGAAEPPAADVAAEHPGASGKGTAALKGASKPQCKHMQVLEPALEEPALPCSWLQMEVCNPLLHPTAAGSRCPIASLAAIQAVAVAERADLHSSSAAQEAPGCCLNTETEAATAGLTAGTDAACKSVSMVCLEVPGPTATPCKQVLPAAVIPAAVPAVGCSSHVSSSSSQQLQANNEEGPAASKPQSTQQNLTHLVASWRMALGKLVGRRRWGADAAEKHVKRRPSLAVRPRLGNSTPKLCSNTPSKPLPPAPRSSRAPAVTTAQAGLAQDNSTAAAAASAMQANPEDAAGSLPAGHAAEAVGTRQQQEEEEEQLQQLQQQQEEDQCKEQQPASPAPPSSQEAVTQPHDDSCPVVLSPASLLIEVPVCLPQQPSQPVDVSLLQTALSAAAAVLRARPAVVSAAAAEEEAAGHAGASSSAASLEWDASWGNLTRQPAGSSTGLSSAAAGWCTPAVMAMLSSEALQGRDATAMVDKQQGGQQGARDLPGRQHTDPQQQQQQQQRQQVGHVLLQQMLAADMVLGAGSDQLLPVVLFPAADDYCCADMAGGNSSRGTSSICLELQHHCGYKQQSTVHLELYFDWSWLQPQHQTSGSKGSKRNSSTMFAAAALKRIKTSRDTNTAAQQAQQQDTAGLQAALLDSAAWLPTILQHPGLIQLQHDLQQRPLEGPVDGINQPGSLAAGPDSAHTASSMQVLAQQHSRRVFAAVLQLPAGCCGAAASKPPAAWSTTQSAGRPAAAAVELAGDAGCLTGSPEQPEAVPQEVAAAAAAWRLARQSKEPAASTMAGPTAAAALPTNKAAPGEGATAGAAPGAAAATDLDFFMQVQGAGLRQHKRRFSSAVAATSAGQLERCPAAAAAPPTCTNVLPAAEGAVGAVQQVALSSGEQAAAKRPRLADRQQLQQGSSHAEAAGEGCQRPDLARQQQQQDAAHVTADLALTSALRGADAAQLATAEAGEAAAAATAGPSVITTQVSSSILQMLLQLDTTRQQLLSAMQCPGPELVECPLWQDAAAQQLLLQLKARQQKQQQETGKGPTAQQRQHNKQLVVLVLLSQTAACLLHYGIKVAHMFLQHGLQRLPSVSDACRSSLLALSAASEKLEQPAVPRDAAGIRLGAAGTAGSSCQAACPSGGEHPKLARLLELVLQLKSRQPDCRLLLVSESKAFFNLYHTLSAAGIIAVQFDRDRKLQAPHAAAGRHPSSSDETADPMTQAAGADTAQQTAWQQCVLDALAAAHSTQDCCCVLATHDQLHHPCMPLQEFRVLIEYVAFEDTAAGATAAAAAAATQSVQSGRAAVQASFGSDRHYVFKVQEPDLAQAASRLGEAAAAPAAAVAHTAGDAAAAATAVSMGGSCKTPAGIVHPQQTAEPDAAVAAAAAAAVQGRVQNAAAQHAAAAALQAGTAQDTAATTAAAAEAQAQELPLVLNVSPGSLIKHRQPLYQSLLQLEAQGYVLVERCLGGSRGSQPPAAAVPAAVDVVLTPRSCLCIWDDRKLPQEADAALQCLSRSLLGLSMAYDSVFFVLEQHDSMLQAIIRSSSNLQGLARAVGVRLQLLTCFTAANTQDAVLHICQETVSNFWASAAATSSSSNASTVQPPQGISDLPTPAEAQLASCCALNPLSAAVLASQGATLQTLFQLAMSGEAAANPLLQVCLPERSLQLLHVQASALAACIEQHRKQQEEQLLQPSQEDDYCQQHQQQQQQQQYGQQQLRQQGAWHRDGYCATGPQDLRQQRMPDTADDGRTVPAGPSRGAYQPPDQQQWQQEWQQHSTGAAGQPMQGAPGNWQQQRQQQHWQQGRQQQQHWQEQPHLLHPTSKPDLHAAAAAAGCGGGRDAYDGMGDLHSGPTPWQDSAGPDLPCQHTGHMQAEPQWLSEAAMGNGGLQPGRPDRQPLPVDQLQDTYVDDGLEASECVDPSRVLDDFLLSRRSSPRAAAAAGSTARYSSARPMQQGAQRSSHWAQQHRATAAMRAGRLGDEEPVMMQRRHAGQQHRQPHAGQHMQQVRWGEAHTDPHECYPERGHAAMADWEAPWEAAAAGAGAEGDEVVGYQAHYEPEAGGTDFLEVQHGGEVGQGHGFWGQQQPGHQQWFDQGPKQRQQGVHINQPYSRSSNIPSWAEDGELSVDQLQPQAGYQVRPRHAHQQQQQQVAGMFQQRGGLDSGPTGYPAPRHSASRGGMFAAAVRSLRDDPGVGDGFAPGAAASPPAARQQAYVLGAAAAGRRPAQRDPGFADGPPAGRGSMLPAQRRPGGAIAPSSSNGSGLTVSAFMPHHNPSKQLKYKLPAAAAGVAKRKKGAKKGGFQTKLFWG